MTLRRVSLAKHTGIGLMILGGMLSPSLAQKTEQELPVVSVGTMPLYPRLALVAHIEGVVKIKVTTDGERVSSLDTESGPPMLVEAAKKIIQTWEFEKHKPTSFITTFRYRIEGPAQCGFSNGTAVLHVPLEVEVNANGVQTCDPAVAVKPKGHAGA
jgi:hypothetical protein